MKKNKAYMLEQLMEKTSYSEAECTLILDVLDDHFIIGHNNKEKIKQDFIERLNLDNDKASELYNICCEIIVSGIFK